MGQPITVVEKRSSNRGVVRFETNRPLSGMGHERYTEAPSELLDKMNDVLARRLFEADSGVEAVHINGSVVTVTLGRGHDGAGLGDVVRGLFLHYGEQPGAAVTPPTDEGDKAPETTADPGDTPAAQNAEEPAAAEPAAPEVAAQKAEAEAGDGAATAAAEPVTPVEGVPDELLEPAESPAAADAAAAAAAADDATS